MASHSNASVDELRLQLREVEKERDHWRANHDNVVVLNAAREGWKKALYEECGVLDSALLRAEAEITKLRGLLVETAEVLKDNGTSPCIMCGGSGVMRGDSAETPTVRVVNPCAACDGAGGNAFFRLAEKIKKARGGG